MVVFWIIALVVLVVIELATVGLASIWFALGAVAALIAAALSAPFWLQTVLFLAVSLISLVLTRPLAVKWLAGRRAATNFDRVLEMTGVVTEEIDNYAATGTVRVDGKEWTARSEDGRVIPAGSVVRPRYIDGVKLIVTPAAPPDPASFPRMREEQTR